MKALILTEYKKLVFTDSPTPQVAENDVLIRVNSCGICGSDIHGFDGSTGRRIPPVIMGHEASGDIVSTGRNVQAWKPGDRVTFDSTIFCGKCDYCRQGLVNLCDNRRVLGVSCGDYRQNGAFAEYVAVPEHILYRLPNDVTYEQAAMVEPVSIAFHSVNLTPRTINDTVVVVGAGMIGLLVIQTLRLVGCGKIIAMDIDPARLKIAAQFGADYCLLSDNESPSHVFELTGGRGADIALDVVGINQSVNTAVACLKKNGSLTLIGNISPHIDLPLQSIVTRQVTLRGSCASNGEYGACLDMIARKAINVDPIISAVAPLEEGEVWFNRLYNKEGDFLKVILKP
jgi:L-iditol 2-dehydrogenase